MAVLILLSSLLEMTGEQSRLVLCLCKFKRTISTTDKLDKRWAGNLVGTITLPLPVGTVGGSIAIHPGAVAHELLGHQVLLNWQNHRIDWFSAKSCCCKSSCNRWHSKGHMRLQAKSLRTSSWATEDELRFLYEFTHKKAPHLNQSCQALLEKIGK